ncbi:MAG: sodium:solute symporter [Bacteroidaceae bacterium]|nr:sodium:solute symporter [Bacteroidaceae bacterium]
MTIIAVVLVYFTLLFTMSRWTGRKATNETFYRADMQSPWYMVAFGMVGASISGVTFVSVPGMVMSTQMTYLQTCMGFVVGYVFVAFALLPLYYRLNLTSIYAFLGQRFGRRSHKTGSAFFLLSKMTGATVRFYVVCIILQVFVFEPMGVPFVLTVVLLVALIWLYTQKGGIRTLVWTDSVQTLCLFGALLLIIYNVVTDLGMTVGEAVGAVAQSELSRVFVFDDWVSKQHFVKQFVSGVFITIVMTGLDQDMMQKNLTCKDLRSAQKDMCSYGVAFLPANLLFLSLGVLLVMWYQGQGVAVPGSGDELLPTFIQSVAGNPHSVFSVQCLFVLGIVAASFSSADSALTSLTTIFCVDIREKPDDVGLRKRVHLAMCGLFVLFILMFKAINSTSLIDAVYIIVGYTYGPLLGLFAYGLLTKRGVNDRLVPYIAVVAPLLCYAIDSAVGWLTGYRFGYELLMLNGLLTFVILWTTGRRS